MDDFHHLDTAAFALLESMAAAFAAHEWDGDQDSLTEPVEPGVWRQVSTDHLQCAGRNCSNFRDCAYYQARQNWMEADVIVANHDLVLSDLSLGGGAVLPQPEDSLYIFDEGHHLPDKAVRQAHVSLRARGSQEASSRLARECERQCRQTESDWLRTGLTRLQAAIETLSGLQAELLADIQHWGDQLAGEGESSGEWQKTPLSVEQWQSLSIWGPGLTKALADVAGVLDDLREGEGDEKIRDPALQTWLGGVSRRAGQQLAFWQSLLRQPGEQAPPLARWIRVTPMYPDGQDIEINSCPVVAAEELRGWLWKRAAGVAVTSATLAAMGSFENWRRRCGLSSGAELIVPGPVGWDARVTLCVPMDFPDPRKADLHTLRMIEVLPTLMQLRAGTLVLFASARQMHEVYEGLAPEDQAQVLLQHQGQSKAQLVKTHCQQIDAGGSSTLFGLASLAEGVDLPGAYCEQVIIAKIPFAVPADPVARTLHNWIDASGGQSFMDISLPEAALRLRQACGRLVRSEQDGGLISILDSRLLNSGYGRKLLADLPGSDRLIRSLSDLPLADSVPEAS
jgi:ATP-dependent DNA helicase DinG